MKKIFASLLGLLITLSSLGQAYHPMIRQGVSWDVLSLQGALICQVDAGWRAFFSGTMVTVGSHQYHELRGYSYVPTQQPAPFCPPFHLDLTSSSRLALLREDTTTRRVYRATATSEELLFDFSLMVGDTLHTGVFGPRVIDSVQTVLLLNGQPRRISYLDWFGGGSGDYLLESIGSNFGPFSPVGRGIGVGYSLEAVWENGVMIWGSPRFVLGTTSPLTQASPTVTADFKGRTLRCQLPAAPGQAATVTLRDAVGRALLRRSLTSSVETVTLPELAPGLYFYELTTAAGRAAGRWLEVD